MLADLGVDTEDFQSEIRRRAQHRDDLGGLTVADVDALSSLGVDANELIDRLGVSAPDSIGGARTFRRSRRAGGHIPFTASAKAALERALRDALRLADRHIGSEHVLLGVVAVDADVRAVPGGDGVTYGALPRVCRRPARRKHGVVDGLEPSLVEDVDRRIRSLLDGLRLDDRSASDLAT